MVGRSSAGRGIVGRGRGRGVVGSGRSRGAGGFHGRDSTILGSPGRGCTTLGSRGRGSVGGSPGRGSIGGSSCRGSAVGGSPGRGSGVLGFLGRGSNVGGTPTTSSSGHGNDMADYEHHGLFEEGMDGINTYEEEISEGGGGSNDFPSNPSLRKWVFVTEDGARFNDGGDIARDITEILKNMYNGVWPTWGKIPEVEKEKLYERFKKFYQWDPDNERCVKKIWQKHISKKLSGHLFEARRIAEEKARALGMDVDNDYTTIIPFNPTWIKQEFWRKLVQEHWNLDKWQAVSEANKANRAQFVEGYHTTGSVGYDVARRRFEELMGGPQPSVEFFTFSHARKGTMPIPGEENPSQPVLIDDRARQTVERYKEYMLGKFGPELENHPQHDQECWERAVGKRKKGNSYGSGSSKDPEFVLTGKPSILDNNIGISSVRSHAEAQIQKMAETMEKMKEQHEIEKRELKEQYESQTRESQDKLKKELTDNMTELMKAELMKYLPNLQQPPP